MQTKNTILAIDADNFVYSCGSRIKRFCVYKNGIGTFFKEKSAAESFAQEHSIPNVDEIMILSDPLRFCKNKIKNRIAKIINKFKPRAIKLFISPADGSNFREHIATTRIYKGNRVSEKPHYYNELRDYLVNVWKAEIATGQEADDACAIWALEKKAIIVSNDKDLILGIPGLKYNFIKDELIETTAKQSYYGFCLQVLTGDQSDNIPGCPMIGEVKAKGHLNIINLGKDSSSAYFTRLFNKIQEVYNIQCSKYLQYSPNEIAEYLHEQASLLWIRRKPEDSYLDYLLK